MKDNLKIRSASSWHIKEKRKVRPPCNPSPVSNLDISTWIASKDYIAGLEYSFERQAAEKSEVLILQLELLFESLQSPRKSGKITLSKGGKGFDNRGEEAG